MKRLTVTVLTALLLAFVLAACGGESAIVQVDGDTTDLADKDSDSEADATPDGDTTPDGDSELDGAESDTPDGDPEPVEETEPDAEPDSPDGDGESDGDSPCAPNNCYIDATCYEAGGTPANNACLYCHPGASKTEWTKRALGYACANGGKCDGQGSCALPDGDLEESEAEPELDYDIDTAAIEAGNPCQSGMTICGKDTLFTCMNTIWAIAADCFDGSAKATCYDAHCVTPKIGRASCRERV